MGDIKDMLKRADIHSLIGLLLYSESYQPQIVDNYEEIIEENFRVTFQQIECLMQDGNGKMDQTRCLIYDLAELHDEAYFEAGVLFGFRLAKSLDQGYEGCKEEIRRFLNREDGVAGGN